MPNTPNLRTTRSSSLTLNDLKNELKTVIENSKTEILKTMKRENDKLQVLVGSLQDRILELETKNANLESKVGHLSKLCQEATAGVSKNPIQPLEDTIEEASQRHIRRKNLIVAGLPEYTDGSPKERSERDMTAIKAIATELGTMDLQPSGATRIGRINPPRPRLLRFKCSTFESKISVLKRSKNLRHSPNFKTVFIKPDLTKLQREADTALRDELKRRRESGERVIIRRGRIVDVNQDQNFY